MGHIHVSLLHVFGIVVLRILQETDRKVMGKC